MGGGRSSCGLVRARQRSRLPERTLERVDVERVDEHSSLRRDELGRSAEARRDDGAPARHALEERLSERLEQARLADDVARGDELRHVGVRHAAEQAHSLASGERAAERAKASARRTTFLRSSSAPMQRKRGGPFGGGSTAKRSRSTPLETTSVLPRAAGSFVSSSRRR